MELFKLLDLKLITAQIVCFVLVLLILKQFLWKPVFAILEERRRKIDEQLQSIEAAKTEAAAFRAQMEKALANIDETMHKRLREIEHAGEAKSREMKEKARQEAERIIADAREELRHELMRSREALKGEVVEMVIQVTEKMIQEKLTFDQDKKMIEQLLAELDKAGKAGTRG